MTIKKSSGSYGRHILQTTITSEAPLTMKTSVAPILGLILATTASVLTPRASNCNGAGYKPTVENWKDAKVDRSLRAFWDGGKDAEGVDWPGANQYGNPRQFASMLGTRLQNSAVWSCSKLPSDVKCTVERCTGMSNRQYGSPLSFIVILGPL